MMKIVTFILLVFLIVLQVRLWSGEGSIQHWLTLSQEKNRQEASNQVLREQNQALADRVRWLKSGLPAVEALAREEMGLIKEGETFFRYSKIPQGVTRKPAAQ